MQGRLAHKFSESEMDFLLKNIERGTILIETGRIDLSIFGTLGFDTKIFDGKPYNYLHKIANAAAIETKEYKKEQIIQFIKESDDFSLEGGHFTDDDYYDYKLITYKHEIESEEMYLERLLSEGRELIRKTKAKLARERRKEKRKVLCEKAPKKYTRLKRTPRYPEIEILPFDDGEILLPF